MPDAPLNPTAPLRGLRSLTAGVLLLLLATGGPRFLVQTIAWTSMLATYAQHDSLGAALGKTFDGRHPCKLCLEIRQDKQKEQREGPRLPGVNLEKLPELFCDARSVTVPPAPTTTTDAPPERLNFFYDYFPTLPTPPPRLGAAWL